MAQSLSTTAPRETTMQEPGAFSALWATGLLRILEDEERAAISRRDFARANEILTKRLGLKARILTADGGAR